MPPPTGGVVGSALAQSAEWSRTSMNSQNNLFIMPELYGRNLEIGIAIPSGNAVCWPIPILPAVPLPTLSPIFDHSGSFFVCSMSNFQPFNGRRRANRPPGAMVRIPVGSSKQ